MDQKLDNKRSIFLAKFTVPRKRVPLDSWELGNYDASYPPSQTHRSSSQDHGHQEERYQSHLSPAHTSPPKGLLHKFGRMESETWLVEALSMAISLTAALLAFIYLRRYDGKPYPDLVQGISLNTLLSVAVTIMITALGGILSSGLGQLNWIRAKQNPVSLSKMDTMDQGSRGAWGGVLVIFNWAGGPIGALGALTVILALAAAPLAQEAILIAPEQEVLISSQAPLIASCNSSTGFGGRGRTAFMDGQGNSNGTIKVVTNQIPARMKGEYYNAVYGNIVNTSFSRDFATCRSGNCTWEPFVTLSLCSKCVNITTSLKLVKDVSSEQYSLPGERTEGNKTTIIGGQIFANVFDTHHSNRIHSSNATAFLFAFASFANGGRPTEAVECAMSFCAQVINATVVNGMLNEKVIETYDFDDNTITEMTDKMTIQPPVPLPPGSPFINPISVKFTDAMWLSEAISFKGENTATNNKLDTEFEILLEGGPGNLSSTMDKMALTMGRALRFTCEGGAMKVPGIATHSIVMVRIRWWWLLGPLIVEVLGLVFFLIVIVLNVRSGASLWKTSFLAVAFHGVKLESASGTLSLEKIHQMQDVSNVRVKLQDDDREGIARSRLRY